MAKSYQVGQAPWETAKQSFPVGQAPWEQTANTTQPQIGLADKIWMDISSRGNQLNTDLNTPQNTALGTVAQGIKAASGVAGGVTDVAGDVVNATPVIGPVANAVGGLFEKGFNYLTDNISNTAMFKEAATAPQGTTAGLETALGTASDLGNISNTILAAGSVKPTVDTAANIAKNVANKGNELFSQLTAQSEKQINDAVVANFEKGVKPSIAGKSTVPQLAKYRSNIIAARNTIADNAPNLSYTDEFGDVIKGKTPETLQQLTDAVEQTKKSIFSKYDALAKQAGKSGFKINTEPIGKVLDKVITNESLNFTHPEAVKYAQDIKARLAAARLPDGSPVGYKVFSAEAAQDIVQNYNKSLEAFYRNPTYDTASRAAIDAAVANNFREELDKGITRLTGEQYGALKKQYGALKSIENDVIKATLRYAKKSTKGLIDFTDILSGGQVVNGLLSLSPGMVASGLTQKGIAQWIKYLNDPNRSIKAMFEDYSKESSLRQTNPASSASGNANIKTNMQSIIPSSEGKTTLDSQGAAQAVPKSLPSPKSTTLKDRAMGFINRIKTEGQRGFIKVGTSGETKIHPDDLNTMSDFTDYAAGSYKPSAAEARRLELDASRLWEHYFPNKTMPKTTEGIANEFGRVLEKNNFGKGGQPRDEAGRFTQGK